jgi:tmRNA-binding protein
MKKTDYSSKAITIRLRQTEQLRKLSLSLIKAKKAHDERETLAKQLSGSNSTKEPDSPDIACSK